MYYNSTCLYGNSSCLWLHFHTTVCCIICCSVYSISQYVMYPYNTNAIIIYHMWLISMKVHSNNRVRKKQYFPYWYNYWTNNLLPSGLPYNCSTLYIQCITVHKYLIIHQVTVIIITYKPQWLPLSLCLWDKKTTVWLYAKTMAYRSIDDGSIVQ